MGWVADDATFGARLALVRQRMAWGNVKEAADACGVPVESWRRWERDGRPPRDVVEVAGLIADKTGCDYGWLLAGQRLRARTGNNKDVLRRRPRPSRPPGRPTGSTSPIGQRRTARISA